MIKRNHDFKKIVEKEKSSLNNGIGFEGTTLVRFNFL